MLTVVRTACDVIVTWLTAAIMTAIVALYAAAAAIRFTFEVLL